MERAGVPPRSVEVMAAGTSMQSDWTYHPGNVTQCPVLGVVMELAEVDEEGEVVRNTWQDCTEGCPGTDFECNEGKSSRSSQICE